MKRIHSLILTSIVAMSMFSCGQKNSFEARIDGWGNDTIQMFSWNKVIDTLLIAKDGFFSYNLTIDDTLQVLFFNKREPFSKGERWWIETTIYPGSRESISGTVYDDRLEYSSKGSKTHRGLSEMRQQKLPYTITCDSINQLINSLPSPLDEKGREYQKQLFEQRGAVVEQIRNIRKVFVRQNPNNELSGLYITGIWYDSLLFYVDMVTPKVREGIYKKMLDEEYLRTQKYLLTKEAENNMTEGKPAPQFTLMDLDGKEVSLRDYKGGWVVLDFWGSWCGWCIKGFPTLKASYERHKDKVTFIGIACREKNESDWRKSVAENKLPWLQLINSNDLNSDVSVKYAIEGYPTKIIITPEQTIAKVSVGENSEFYTTLDELLK